MPESIIQIRSFSEIILDDPFFDSLKTSYDGFAAWFERKGQEKAYVTYDNQKRLQGFLYLKQEKGPITDIIPPLNVAECLKVGTFKVNAHGTKLGERFVKIIVDTVLQLGLRIAYVTVFPEHEPLIRILEKYGFVKKAQKTSSSGIEDVYIKDFQYIISNLFLDYPVVVASDTKKWLLSIRPEFHTSLFPDSKLKTESASIIQDTSYTNSITKVYVGFMRDFAKFKPKDCLVIYRCQTQSSTAPAWFNSVATSLCVVEEARPKSSFASEHDFIDYCMKYSVFDKNKLAMLYNKTSQNQLYAVKMLYNLAFPKRPILRDLVDSGAVPNPRTGVYMGLLPLDDAAFKTILDLGGINAGFVIH